MRHLTRNRNDSVRSRYNGRPVFVELTNNYFIIVYLAMWYTLKLISCILVIIHLLILESSFNNFKELYS